MIVFTIFRSNRNRTRYDNGLRDSEVCDGKGVEGGGMGERGFWDVLGRGVRRGDCGGMRDGGERG